MTTRLSVRVLGSDPITEAGVASQLRGRPEVWVLDALHDDDPDVAVVVVDALDDAARCTVRAIRRGGCNAVVAVCTTIDEAVMIAGLCRALAMTALAEEAAGEPVPSTRPELVRAAQWEAARYGLRGPLVDLRRLQSNSAETVIAALLEYVRPSLEAAGDWDEINRMARKVLRDGNSATRQRKVLEEEGSFQAVIEHLRRETATGALPP